MSVEDRAPPGPPAPAPAPPAVPAEPGRRPPPAAWGPWTTALLGVLLVAGYLLLQGVLTVVGAGVAAALDGAADAAGLWRSLEERAGLLFTLASLVAAPAAVAAAVALAASGLRRRGTAEPRAALRRHLGLVRPRLADAVVWTLATAGYLGLYEVAARLLDRPSLPDFMVELHASAGWLPALLFVVVVVAPAVEELLFRGFLLPGLAAGPGGPAGAVVASALLFALVHLQYDPFDMGAVLGLGLLFGAARWASGSLWLTIGLHAAVNLLAAAQLVHALGWSPSSP